MRYKTYTMEDALEAIIDYRGKTPKKSESGIPTLSAKTVRNNFIDYNNCYYISEEEYKRFMVRGFPKVGDILLTTEAPLGMTAKLDRADVAIAQRLLTLRGKADILDNDYLLYFLQSPKGQHLLKSHETGTTVTGIKQAVFRKLEISIPSITVQKQIAMILSSIDEKISVNTKINEKLEQQAQAIFKSWFVDFEPFGGVMPDDWKVTTLGNIAKICTKSINPLKQPELYLEHYSIPAYDEQHYPIFEYASEIKSNKYILTKDSVMISKLNPNTKRIWRPLCLSDKPVCSTEFIVYEAVNSKHKDYIYSLIDSQEFSDFLCAHTTGSTNSRQRATPKTTLDFSCVLPTEDIISQFCGLVTPIYDQIGTNLIENQRLAGLRDTLLPKLMSGEIDISQVKI